ncbi:MAG: hypothetical protein H6619_06665 [Deltaproteobacteria bacterium]|nr:hypothetical protein [Deltaproteobacteria bacterium]
MPEPTPPEREPTAGACQPDPARDAFDEAIEESSIDSRRVDSPYPEIFPPAHRLSSLVRATHSGILAGLSATDISFIWNSTKFGEERRGIRTCYSELHGPGAELVMPLAASYFTSPGKNTVFFPDSFTQFVTPPISHAYAIPPWPGVGFSFLAPERKEHERIDVTAIEYLQSQGLIGVDGRDFCFVSDLKTMRKILEERGRRVYSIDDLGEDFDHVSANPQSAMEVVNSKEHVAELTQFAPLEVSKQLDEITDDDYFHAAKDSDGIVFVKTCNMENSGAGVSRITCIEEFRAKIADLKREYAGKDHLNQTVIIQPMIKGKNRSFQVFLDPKHPELVPVVALTDQLMEADGVSYGGSINHEISAERLEVVGDAIIDLVANVRQRFPEAMGFLMCDYFEDEDGRVVLFYTGLRPTGNTPGAMVRMWFEEKTGQTPTVTSFVFHAFNNPGLRYSEIAKALGELADTEQMLRSGYGVLPWGHNHVQGNSLFMLITPDRGSYDEFRKLVDSRLAPLTLKSN